MSMKSFIIKLNTWVIRFLLPGYHIVPNIYGISFRKQYDIRANASFKSIADLVISEKRTYLGYDRLNVIYQSLNQAKKVASRLNIPFIAMEVGVFRGGASKFMCEAMSDFSGEKKFIAVDTFSGHAAEDVTNFDGWHTTGTFINTSHGQVIEYLSKYPFAEVHKGRIQDTYETHLSGTQKYSFVHIDVDIEKPTSYLLEKLNIDLIVGGVIVIDDFGFESCPGLRTVVQKFIDENSNFCGLEVLSGQAILIKTSDNISAS